MNMSSNSDGHCVCLHNVLNLDLMFKDPGAQTECFEC